MMAADVLTQHIRPALALLPPKMNSESAQAMLLAIGMQESALTYRKQVGGPARGFWQFELGGLQGVLKHPTSSRDAAILVNFFEKGDLSPHELLESLADDDQTLPAGLARLLLWTHPRPIPDRSEVQGSWTYYTSLWRPGMPHPETWADHWENAWDTVNDSDNS